MAMQHVMQTEKAWQEALEGIRAEGGVKEPNRSVWESALSKMREALAAAQEITNPSVEVMDARAGLCVTIERIEAMLAIEVVE